MTGAMLAGAACARAFHGWSIAEPKLTPAARLAWAIELAGERLGSPVLATIYVHPLTAAETDAPEGVELVPRLEVGRFGYWFPLAEDGLVE
jgi:hypothetical protein